MTLCPAHSTRLCRTKTGACHRQWVQSWPPLFSRTGARPAYFWKLAASAWREQVSSLLALEGGFGIGWRVAHKLRMQYPGGDIPRDESCGPAGSSLSGRAGLRGSHARLRECANRLTRAGSPVQAPGAGAPAGSAQRPPLALPPRFPSPIRPGKPRRHTSLAENQLLTTGHAPR